jgi:hypothetical protein
MPQVDQIQIGTTTYDILQSDNATFTGTTNDNEDGSSTSWITVAKLASSETNASIFTKLSSMFNNIRFLYSKMGDIDVSGIGTSIGDAIRNLNDNKADKDHTHDASTLKASDGTNLIVTTQTADNSHVPSALLVKNMNDTLTTLSNSFSNNNPTLAWSTKSTVGTAGGVAFTINMPANPNTNTTYGTAQGCYGSLSGTTLTLNTRNFRV